MKRSEETVRRQEANTIDWGDEEGREDKVIRKEWGGEINWKEGGGLTDTGTTAKSADTQDGVTEKNVKTGESVGRHRGKTSMEDINNPSQIKQFCVKRKEFTGEGDCGGKGDKQKNKRKLVGGAWGSPIKKQEQLRTLVLVYTSRGTFPHLAPPIFPRLCLFKCVLKWRVLLL